ncbi:class I SAM-dependent methyltransferase [Chitinophaga oryzae]|uniref:Class I SAM-dependent methyltransferase n=1 Tax=Chitinophaga oryzae TaxID=2725414 RepID=A0AAE6ZK88_9BACT|nr:class I SAM-dependent methyltransferase [Chitinophaga oryzae]QJB33683.1 class I SAM-dependent methyltransferase [Chitinophaga oryzae]QJB40208.1 class I SAM-dependent methyltransferase [Chitinophaga oryzae]
MKQKWDERYRQEGFAYGKEPNEFFREWLPKFTPGAILMPADGEGRNGVFAAQQGWQVTSFDQSDTAKVKAEQLAAEREVTLNYIVGNLEDLRFEEASFDAMGLIYAHFAGNKKAQFHRQLDACLKPGGVIIFEAFSKKHQGFKKADPRVGGPDALDDLYSQEEIITDFGNYDVLLLAEEEVLLNEGSFHAGRGSVIRFVGRKKNV